MKATMTRRIGERVERAQRSTVSAAQLPHDRLKAQASFPSHRVAGRPRTRHALLDQARATNVRRAATRDAFVMESPSFLHAIAQELAGLQQESVSNTMEDARRLLGEAFVAVEHARSETCGALSNQGAKLKERQSR